MLTSVRDIVDTAIAISRDCHVVQQHNPSDPYSYNVLQIYNERLHFCARYVIIRMYSVWCEIFFSRTGNVIKQVTRGGWINAMVIFILGSAGGIGWRLQLRKIDSFGWAWYIACPFDEIHFGCCCIDKIIVFLKGSMLDKSKVRYMQRNPLPWDHLVLLEVLHPWPS